MVREGVYPLIPNQYILHNIVNKGEYLVNNRIKS